MTQNNTRGLPKVASLVIGGEISLGLIQGWFKTQRTSTKCQISPKTTNKLQILQQKLNKKIAKLERIPSPSRELQKQQ